MTFDYRKLRGKIKEVYGTQDAFAKELGISRGCLSQRLNNSLEFSQQEMNKAIALLNLSVNDISAYFFNEIV